MTIEENNSISSDSQQAKDKLLHTVFKLLLKYDTEAEQLKINVIIGCKISRKLYQSNNRKTYGTNLYNSLQDNV